MLREQVLPSIQEASQMTEEGYQSGRVDLIRVLEARRTLIESRIAETTASATLGRAWADLERALGADLEGKSTHGQ